jgi:chromosome segregation ATPase
MRPLFVSRKRHERLAGEAAYAAEQNTDITIVNQRLTKDLAAARRELADVRKVEESLARQIHEMAQPVEPSDVEVDAAQLRLELDAERRRTDELQQRLDETARELADGEWRGRARRAEKRVAHLEKELDNACGMPPGGLLDSSRWQPGYVEPTPNKAVSP